VPKAILYSFEEKKGSPKGLYASYLSFFFLFFFFVFFFFFYGSDRAPPFV